MIEIETDISVENELTHNCGVVAFYFDTPTSVSHLVPPMQALNHRGQEGIGLVGITHDKELLEYRAAGLVRDHVDEIKERDAPVNIAIGHDRYSTSGTLDSWQPFAEPDGSLVVAHNGNITNPLDLLHHIPLAEQSILTSDTHALHKALANRGDETFEQRLQTVMPEVRGAYSLVMADGEAGALYVLRDPWGVRPLHVAALDDGNGYMAASETVAFRQFVKDNNSIFEVAPGQCLRIDANGIEEVAIPFPKMDQEETAQCIFELVYLGFPVSEIFGVPVSEFRRACGDELAQMDLSDGFVPDLIVPVRDSGALAAEGYSEAMIEYMVDNGYDASEISQRIPREAIYRSNYVDRTFILPDDRSSAVEQKFTIDPRIVNGKNIVVIDDSVVRGTTMTHLVQMLRDAGAASVHIRSASPPIRHACYYGVDFDGRDGELVADGRTEDEVGAVIGTNSIRYMDLETMVAIAQEMSPRGNDFCTACFSGQYPIPVEKDSLITKAQAC